MTVEKYLGKYGRMRERYLKDYKREMYDEPVRDGKLFDHCADIDDTASEWLDRITKSMAKADGLTEEMKNTDTMKWIGLMNNYKHCAEEIICNDLIYV